MKIKVKKSQLNGEIAVPGSKSHTIRALAIATVADGVSLIRSPLLSEDTFSALGAAEALGAKVDREGKEWKIIGTGGSIEKPPTYADCIDMGNSGTSLRIFTALAAMGCDPISFDGDESLRTRPMGTLLNALQDLGVFAESDDGKCPLNVCGPARGGETTVDGTSSQFITALLIALPLAERDTFIKISNLNEIPYVEITLSWLAKQGIVVEYPDDLASFCIKGGQKYHAFDSVIPADFSTAAFPLVAAALTRGVVSIKNLDFNDLQGDKVIFDFLRRMGASVNCLDNETVVSAVAGLHGEEFDLNATPDALPVMAVAGACSKGTTFLINCPQARIKETDRISCMVSELGKFGCKLEELEDGLVVHGSSSLRGAEVKGYGDHRIVMALTIAGMMADGETIISSAESAAVTYPSFIEDFKRLGADISIL